MPVTEASDEPDETSEPGDWWGSVVFLIDVGRRLPALGQYPDQKPRWQAS